MVLWIALALMTGAAVMTVLWPLSRHAIAWTANSDDVSFYRAQLDDIEAEQRRGLLSVSDAQAARIEAGRRLLRSDAGAIDPVFATGEPALRRRRAASALAISLVPLVGLGIYGGLGSPMLAAKPSLVSAAAGGGEPGQTLGSAIAEIENRLATHPADRRGWDVIAPVYVSLGRYDDAVRAYGAALRLGGDDVGRLTGYGEALVAAANGVVSAEARAAFDRAVALDHASAKAGFYLALAAEQDGEVERARAGYRAVLAQAAPNAPWRDVVDGRLSALPGARAASAPIETVAAGPDIRAMVSGLDARLRATGGSEPEWARLVRSYVVLGERNEALDRLGRARTALASDPHAGARLDRLAQDLGLSGTTGR